MAVLFFAIPGLTRASRSVVPGDSPRESTGGRVIYTTFKSASLKQEVNCAISLPESYDKDPARHYPVVFFLHGLFNNERDWEERGIQRKLVDLRAAGKVGEYIVAIPYGANSFYLNGKDGTRYEDAIVKDFIPYVDHTYRTLGNQQGRVIEGISMGGYGALVIAFKYPNLFSGVVTHCAALFDELPKPPTSASDMRGKYRYEIASKIYGNPPDQKFFEENSPLYLAKTNAAKIKGLKIYFDVGSEDRYGFDTGNKQLHEALMAAGVRHDFTLTAGNHGWGYLLGRSEEDFTAVWKIFKP